MGFLKNLNSHIIFAAWRTAELLRNAVVCYSEYACLKPDSKTESGWFSLSNGRFGNAAQPRKVFRDESRLPKGRFYCAYASTWIWNHRQPGDIGRFAIALESPGVFTRYRKDFGVKVREVFPEDRYPENPFRVYTLTDSDMKSVVNLNEAKIEGFSAIRSLSYGVTPLRLTVILDTGKLYLREIPLNGPLGSLADVQAFIDGQMKSLFTADQYCLTRYLGCRSLNRIPNDYPTGVFSL